MQNNQPISEEEKRQQRIRRNIEIDENPGLIRTAWLITKCLLGAAFILAFLYLMIKHLWVNGLPDTDPDVYWR